MTTRSPLTPEEIAAVRKPYRAASLLPGRAYHDAAIHDFERDQWFRRDWIVVGRESDVGTPRDVLPGDRRRRAADRGPGRDDVLRGFYNVCQHRGTAVVEEPCGVAVRFQCPYHAWIYDLDGSLIRAKHTDDLDDFTFAEYGLRPIRVDTWQGFVFVSLDPDATPLGEWLGDLGPHLARFDFGDLRVAHTETYEVDANWKFIGENYSECYHCPGIHPQLNKLTPYDLGGDFAPNGPWQGGWMELVDDAETMALDGGHRAGRPAMAGMTRAGRPTHLLLPDLAVDIPVDPPGLPARPPARAGRGRAHPDHLRLAVRAGDDRRPRLRPVGRHRVLGSHEPPGLARLRAPATRDAVTELDGRALLEPGAERPRVRPDGGRPLCRRRGRQPPDRPLALRPADAQGRGVRRRHPGDPVAAVDDGPDRREGQGPRLSRLAAPRWPRLASRHRLAPPRPPRPPRKCATAKTPALGALGDVVCVADRSVGPVRDPVTLSGARIPLVSHRSGSPKGRDASPTAPEGAGLADCTGVKACQ